MKWVPKEYKFNIDTLTIVPKAPKPKDKEVRELKLIGRKEAVQMKELWTSGTDQQAIAKKFTDLGYTTRNGDPLRGHNISWAISYKAKGRGPNKSKRQPVKETASTISEDFMLDVIANKNLTATQKVKVLTALLA